MSEVTNTTTKPKADAFKAKMNDGREVEFVGKRKVLKETLLDESKIILVGDTVTLQDGAVSIRMDLRDGQTFLFPIKAKMVPQFAGHGAEQKYGDELASPASQPLSYEDMALALNDLHEQLYVTESWTAEREGGGGFSGAGVVVRALMEASGKTQEEVKKFLDGKIEAAKAANQKLSRKDLYDSFRNPKTKVGQIIKRLEEERLASASSVDADAALAELGAS